MNDDPARARFYAIQAMRWIGMALAVVGIMAIYGKIDLPREAGAALFLAGLACALIVPTLLARRWKTPPP